MTPLPRPTSDVLDKYCVTCHNARLKTAGLLLDSLDVDHVGDHAEEWEKVVTQASHGRDAAAGTAAAGRGHVSRASRRALETRARRGGGRNAEPGPRCRFTG